MGHTSYDHPPGSAMPLFTFMVGRAKLTGRSADKADSLYRPTAGRGYNPGPGQRPRNSRVLRCGHATQATKAASRGDRFSAGDPDSPPGRRPHQVLPPGLRPHRAHRGRRSHPGGRHRRPGRLAGHLGQRGGSRPGGAHRRVGPAAQAPPPGSGGCGQRPPAGQSRGVPRSPVHCGPDGDHHPQPRDRAVEPLPGPRGGGDLPRGPSRRPLRPGARASPEECREHPCPRRRLLGLQPARRGDRRLLPAARGPGRTARGSSRTR